MNCDCFDSVHERMKKDGYEIDGYIAREVMNKKGDLVRIRYGYPVTRLSDGGTNICVFRFCPFCGKEDE